MFPMFIYTSNYLKCGIIRVSHFHKRYNRFPIRSTWKCSVHPACAGTNELTGYIRLHSQAKGFKYQNLSTQVMEKVESNVSINNFQDLPSSSTYETAMEALSSLILRQKRGSPIVQASPVVHKYTKLDRMRMYIKILELEEHIDGLKIIHVAGTKGKGSTCTFSEAILRECGFRTGLFTSPHLVDVRERFRINGLDISEDKFLSYFWDCWNRLKEHVTEDLPMPALFQFLTVLAFKIFISEQVDVAIIEVGLGGKNDSTNVIKEPIVCGIASLGMDHTESLGNTIGQIASHKAGIFKPQIPAFTVPQLSEAMDVLQEKAHELLVPLNVALPLDYRRLDGLKLSLSGDHQFTNAGLAVSLCKCWLQRTGNWGKVFQYSSLDNQDANLPEPFLRGLGTAQLSGRAQVFHDLPSRYHCSSEVSENSVGELIFYLDGAHSPESMEACAKWFSTAVQGNKKVPGLSSFPDDVQSMDEVIENGYIQCERSGVEESYKRSKKILLFNCMEVRDPQILLPRLVHTCGSLGTHFSKAIFVPSMSTYNKVTSGDSVIHPDTSRQDLSWQFSLQRLWEKIIHELEGDILDKSSKFNTADYLPPHEFLDKDASHCSPADGNLSCSAVISSLPLAIKWLRDCVRDNPNLRVEVLVTGSLHLVGDVLKLLKR